MDELEELFKKAARAAIRQWVTCLPEEDLSQELWYWYLSRPSVRAAFADLDTRAQLQLAIRQAHRVVSEYTEKDHVFREDMFCSVDDVKQVLKGEANTGEISRLLPAAFSALSERHTRYSDALMSRYRDGNVPEQGAAAQLLSDALAALTQEVNRLKGGEGLAVHGGPKLRNPVPAEARKLQGSHSDPTATAALALLAGSREAQELYIDDWSGVNVVPATESKPYQLSVFDAEFNDMPRIEMYRAYVFPDLYPEERI